MRPEEPGDVVALVLKHELPDDGQVGGLVPDLDLEGPQPQPGRAAVAVDAAEILVLFWTLEFKNKNKIKTALYGIDDIFFSVHFFIFHLFG